MPFPHTEVIVDVVVDVVVVEDEVVVDDEVVIAVLEVDVVPPPPAPPEPPVPPLPPVTSVVVVDEPAPAPSLKTWEVSTEHPVAKNATRRELPNIPTKVAETGETGRTAQLIR